MPGVVQPFDFFLKEKPIVKTSQFIMIADIKQISFFLFAF